MSDDATAAKACEQIRADARALLAIADALESLSAEEARRVIRAVAILHGIELDDD